MSATAAGPTPIGGKNSLDMHMTSTVVYKQLEKK
jgi:hypothetical protein